MRPIDADAVCERCRASGATCTGKDCEIPNMPTLTPQNEPLTIEQLREMDGEAIYWPKNKMWLIVYLNHPDFGDCAVNREVQYLPLEKCEQRKVYRRPPERQEDA